MSTLPTTAEEHPENPRASLTFEGNTLLSAQQFTDSGYIVLPGLIPESLQDRLRPEVDRWVDDGLRSRSIAACADHGAETPPPLMELEMPAHGELLTYEPLLRVIADLMGAPFVFHHLHSDRHGPGVPGKPWHHDREPNDRGDPELLMVHALHYLGGLDGTIGSLAMVPGSHRRPRSKSAFAHLGSAELPGEVVIDTLPPGSTVLINSALLHARRPAPSPAGAAPRYFVDACYCQTGARWRPAKPYWRQMLATARTLGLDGGRWPELFAERHFTEYARSA
ncbi:phytanoyl-CoA dioxygenase family protein [Streptomyces sp. NBC_01387]|uniref:phytanoyl-CoA dioxygenase family protein n=1 Tax=unclassified Streptomyces TaxID=2593676 RepID=UPI002024DCCD|nr:MULTISPECIES: phytanoyl-CoA dioxygenase family protein [unclassified Streptomyces]MCX4552692.1 phytanoyl-CoA dioxygenase family protein [Streptomyces sp. NBC_01500]WSC24032.1 phytanoyl-CoA dioxygenase family protein [Streptomyces sp. NBC_01766]WSV57915.1 phytanoyl-CoA dioxygenase family protein [Streptomyces sp. NBC_01014]